MSAATVGTCPECDGLTGPHCDPEKQPQCKWWRCSRCHAFGNDRQSVPNPQWGNK